MAYFRCIKLIAVLLVIVPSISHARWATYEDSPFITEFVNKNISVNKDGTYEIETEQQLLILKESGRELAAKYLLGYNQDSETIKLITAKTIYQNKEYIVSKDKIENKPLASEQDGFDQMAQIAISFPKPEIGAKIYLKYKKKVNKVAFKNEYASVFDFGDDSYWQDARVKISSKIPLNISVNDPDRVLKSTINNEKTQIKIELIKPAYRAIIDEPDNAVLDPKLTPYISVSSFNKWGDVADKLSADYEQIVQQPLPVLFEGILKAAGNDNTTVGQVNTVTSLINEKIKYFGDWRTIAGGYIPRSLASVASTQVGDCKDFSAATVAILRKMGYKAQFVWVFRGRNHVDYPMTLPTMAFNHAMVKVTDKDNKVYWIDPTNLVSMADGIFPDIAGKKVLVLNDKQSTYERIPETNYSHAQIIMENEIYFKKNDFIDKQSQLTLTGEVALIFAGAMLKDSKKSIEDALFYAVSNSYLNEKDKKDIVLPDLNSRIVTDLTFKLAYQQQNAVFYTNLGQAFRLRARWIKDFINISDEYISDLFLIPHPVSYNYKSIFKDKNIKNCERFNIKISSPWVEVERQCSIKGNDTEITDKVAVMKNFITNQELKGPVYKKFKAELEYYFKDSAVVF